MNTSIWMSRLGLAMIFLYCLGVSIFFSDFSEIHLALDFLPFPVFIGEIVLCACLLLFLWTYKDKKKFASRTALLLMLYFGWVGIKALFNYVYDGPLTCRNAALFYYPVFAVFTYWFYRKSGIPRWVLMSLAFVAAGIVFFKIMDLWFWWTYVMLFMIGVLNARSLAWRLTGGLFLGIVLVFATGYLYEGPRAHFVSVFCAVVFLLFYFSIVLLRRLDFIRFGILLAAFMLFIGGFLVFSNSKAVSSLVSIKGVMGLYKEKDKLYHEREAVFAKSSLPVQLYNANAPLPVTPVVPARVEALVAKPLASYVTENIVANKARRVRPIDLEETNIVFRLFVWRDMAKELIREKAWLGFSLGKPQRSRSLEVLGWASSEWLRDGWITPHNSYFHIIYRSGIVGFFLIGVLLFLVGGLVRDFSVGNSAEGGLLVGALVYWLVLSNFFVILELPHNAIVFWSLLGVTCAYRDGLRELNPSIGKVI